VTTVDGAVVVAGRSLGRRVVELGQAARRLEAFLPDRGDVGDAEPDPGPTPEDCRALVMRAVHVASDPVPGRMLRHLCEQPASGSELADLTGQPRLAAWEEISDLVQVGLAERDLERDLVRPTPAGRALVELVVDMADAAWAEARR
jgi:hypothetical protein